MWCRPLLTKLNQCVFIDDISDIAVNGTALGVGGYLDIGLFDTMYDMLVNFAGAMVFSVMGYFYVKRRTAKNVLDGIVPESWSEEKKIRQKARHLEEKNKKIEDGH